VVLHDKRGGEAVSALAVSAVVLVCVVTGALLGAFLRSVLPKHHLNDESKDIVKVGIGLIATLVALVLGLLVASAKTSFDTKSDEIKQGAANIILLDRELRKYGPPAAKARMTLRQVVAFRVNAPWTLASLRSLGESTDGGRPTIEDVADLIRELSPQNDTQRWLQSQALQLSTQISQTRWLVVEQSGSTISMPFLVMVVSWLAVIFASLGLFAPRNATVWVVIILCATAVSTSVLLILELDRPFEGLISLSKEPLRNALDHIESER
jgi:hypothetical protein